MVNWSPSPITNFTALPPAVMNSLMYSCSSRASHSSAATAISALLDEPDADIGSLATLLVVDHDAPHSPLAQGGCRKLEAVPAAGSKVGSSVDKQEIAGKFLDRVIRTGQQRQRLVNIGK